MREGHWGKAQIHTAGRKQKAAQGTRAKVPITAEQFWPGGTREHGTYRDSSSRIVRVAHGEEGASGTKSLQPGPA